MRRGKYPQKNEDGWTSCMRYAVGLRLHVRCRYHVPTVVPCRFLYVSYDHSITIMVVRQISLSKKIGPYRTEMFFVSIFNTDF